MFLRRALIYLVFLSERDKFLQRTVLSLDGVVLLFSQL